MSRVNAFFTAILTISGLCFGATLLPTQHSNAAKEEENCQEMIAKEQAAYQHFVAKQLYKKAYLASFDGEWSKAQAASECASLLENGKARWKFEARDLIGQ